ncbi:DUF4136 domain-containing protein [bacterium]|nr:DUF4136 domain-containing protein [bacterium]
MFNVKVFVVVWVTLLLGACTSIEVKTEQRQDVDLASKKLYHFLPIEEWSGDKAIDNQLMHTRVTEAVHRQMNQKGYRRINTPDDADVWVYIRMATKPVASFGWLSWDLLSFGYSDDNCLSSCNDVWGGSDADVGQVASSQQYRKRVIFTLSVIKPRMSEVLWQGEATGTLRNDDTQEERLEWIHAMVSSIVDKYPAKTK